MSRSDVRAALGGGAPGSACALGAPQEEAEEIGY
jgi:hypothetical protein